MTVNAELLEQMRRYLTLDADDNEAIMNLQDAMLSAESDLRASGVPETVAEADAPLRNLLLRKMTVYYYEVRSADSRGVWPGPPPDLNSLVLKLRHAPPLDTGGD